jgi:hypothetical protein
MGNNVTKMDLSPLIGAGYYTPKQNITASFHFSNKRNLSAPIARNDLKDRTGDYGLSPNTIAGLVFAMRLMSSTEIPSLCSACMKLSKAWG